MPRRKATVATFEPRTITVSGTTFTAAGLDSFEIQPVGQKKVGGFGGIQYSYLINNQSEYWTFLDKLAVAACDVADIEGDDSYKVLAIYKDMEKIG